MAGRISKNMTEKERIRICENCDMEFMATRRTQKFCSRTCTAKHYMRWRWKVGTAKGFQKGHVHYPGAGMDTWQAREKLSKRLKGKHLHPATEFKKGHKKIFFSGMHTPSGLRRIAESKKGMLNPQYGKKITEEQKRRLREGYQRIREKYPDVPRSRWREMREADKTLEKYLSQFPTKKAPQEYLSSKKAPRADFEPVSREHKDLLELWKGKFRAGAAKMLETIADCYPNGISKDALGESLGMVFTGGTFNTYLQELKRAGLIKIENGEIKATEELFPE